MWQFQKLCIETVSQEGALCAGNRKYTYHRYRYRYRFRLGLDLFPFIFYFQITFFFTYYYNVMNQFNKVV